MVCTQVYSIYVCTNCWCVGFGTCIWWLYLKLIGSCVVWGSVRLMYHVRLIHWDLSLESQCPSACINYCFLVPSLCEQQKQVSFGTKRALFVKWGVQLIIKCMNCIYLLYRFFALVYTYMPSQPVLFVSYAFPSLCGMNIITLSAVFFRIWGEIIPKVQR